MLPTLPTGTVTFLFTDIEGSTRLWDDNPNEMGAALARHDAILRQVIADHNGVVFKTIGDAFCAAFAVPAQGCAAVLAAQKALHNELWATSTPLKVRMALHTGAAESRDNDYFGLPLNRVARLLSAGHGGQSLLSQAIYELVRDNLPVGALLQPLGEHRLKDLARPETIYQLAALGLPTNFLPLRTLDNPGLPNNLPQQTTSFIGRETELRELKAELKRSRMITLLGPGGTGKTRLSLQVAADVLDGADFDNGVWLVELAPLSDGNLVPQTVAQALKVQEAGGDPITTTLIKTLKEQRLLILLDNCEHVLDAAAHLANDLLRNCPYLHILASSREGLNIPGEITYSVPALTLPDPDKVATVHSLEQYEAVLLFIDRAVAVKRDFTVTNHNAPAIAQVCWRLDGIPLAIELAAARIRSMPVEMIQERLDDRFRLLTGGNRAALPRQQTLRALLDWSYDLLNDDEKTLLQWLSVFAGGWTLEAAEAVCVDRGGNGGNGGGWEDWQAVDILTALVDKSLVVYQETDGANGGPRYRLLETVRQYAGEYLAKEGGTAQATVQARHLSYFVTVAETAEPELNGSEQGRWLNELAAEHDNIRAAIQFGLGQAGEPFDLVGRLCGAIWRFWLTKGYYTEGRGWYRKILIELGQGETLPLAIRAKMERGAGVLAWLQSDYQAAHSHLETARDFYRQLGDKQGVANAINTLGTVLNEQGKAEEAEVALQESLALYREVGDQRGIAAALNNLGLNAFNRGNYTTAQALYEEGLAMARERGDLRGIGDFLNNLGLILSTQDKEEEALTYFQESLVVRREIGIQPGIVSSLLNLGSLFCDRNEPEVAARHLHESLSLCLAIGAKQRICANLYEFACVYATLVGAEDVSQCHAIASVSTRLCGAADALRDSLGFFLQPQQQERFDQYQQKARAVLGEEQWACLYADGQILPMEEACKLALESAPSSSA